jgi:cytochrome c-type biogenesis protein CcmE
VTTTTAAPSLTVAPRRRQRRVRLLVVFALLAGAIVYLLVEGLGSSLDYFDTVGQALAHRTTIGASTIRLEGVVVPGSITHTATGANFEVSGEGHTVVVHNTGSPPELFQTDIPVVVIGHFTGHSDLFVSNQIMVKHSATYIAAHPTRVKGPDGTVVP